MEHFTPAARDLIARATVLAQRSHHCEVCPEHIVLSCAKELEHETLREDIRENWKGPRGVRAEFGFSLRTKRVLQAAYELARQSEVDEEHLVQAMLTDWEPLPEEWTSSEIPNLLGASLQASLQSRGVDTTRLGQLDLANVNFDPEFLRSEAARRLTDLSLEHNAREGGPILLYLLSLLLQGGEAGKVLSEAGVSEAMLTEMLGELPATLSPISDVFEKLCGGPSPLLETLAERDIQLDSDSQKSVRMAEFLSRTSKAEQTDTEHVLAGLILVGCFSPPPRGAVKLLRDLGALGRLQSSGQTYVKISEGKGPPPPASEQVLEALMYAVAAAPRRPELATEHLLFGLASLGRGEAWQRLRAEGVTADAIAARFMQSSN